MITGRRSGLPPSFWDCASCRYGSVRSEPARRRTASRNSESLSWPTCSSASQPPTSGLLEGKRHLKAIVSAHAYDVEPVEPVIESSSPSTVRRPDRRTGRHRPAPGSAENGLVQLRELDTPALRGDRHGSECETVLPRRGHRCRRLPQLFRHPRLSGRRCARCVPMPPPDLGGAEDSALRMFAAASCEP